MLNLVFEASCAGVLATAAGAMAYAVRGRSATWLAPGVWEGPRDRKALALTFDDGPSYSTPELLEVLESHKARATFFEVGKHVERLAEIARRVVSGGHEVSNHGYSHSPFYLRHPQFIEDEVALCQQALQANTGVTPALFRPPYGCRWFGLKQAQARHGLTGVMWSTLGEDWKYDAKRVYKQLKRGVRPGAILCLHDGRELTPRPDIRETIETVKRLLPEVREQGYDLVTVSELLCRKPR